MQSIFPPLPEIDYQSVMDALKGYAYPRKALSDALARGDLVRIKKGLYIQSSRGIVLYSKEILANMIYGPSYISFEYALSYYNLIPEGVTEITSSTTGKSKFFNTTVGRFSYVHFPGAYYSFGFGRSLINDERAFLIADPEKAVADRVLQENGRFSEKSMRQFLFDNMRIEPADFRNLDKSLLNEAARRAQRESLEIVCKVRERIS